GLSLITAKELVDEVLNGIRRRDHLSVDVSKDAALCKCKVPRQGLAQAIRGLVQNALDATESSGAVHIKVNVEGNTLKVEIRDDGTGIAAEVLARVGEPFFTTKSPGGGMGLGVFLARNVIERLDGTLALQSEAGKGTTACVTLPLHGRPDWRTDAAQAKSTSSSV